MNDDLGSRSSVLLLLGILLCVPLGSCIQSDETRSHYLYPDGSIELLVVQDNVHSDQKGLDAIKEEGEWLKKFKTEKTKGFQKTLIRDQRPFSAMLHGKFPSLDAFSKFYDLASDNGKNAAQLINTGKTHQLTIHIIEKKEKADGKKPGKESKNSDKHFPIWKFIPASGHITKTKGCQINPDSTACALDFKEIDLKLHEVGIFDFLVTWEE